MDEKIVLTRQQILSSALKVSKCRSLVKRRFQSLGLKYADSQEVRDRLTKIEKNAFHHLGKFCQSNDIDSLFSMANTWICPYISRHLLSLNPLLACCRRYSR
ncbi:hypothetical protein AEV12_18000, partial [Salmonella enterica subsp. enterica serovar Kentucky]